MEFIEGADIEKLDFVPFKRGDLLYHEGPLLSHYTDASNPPTNYLYRWIDTDETANRWLIFKTSDKVLYAFLSEEISLREIILQQPFVYCIDVDAEFNINNLKIVGSQKLPEDYLPSEDAFFDKEQYEEYASKLKSRLFLKILRESVPSVGGYLVTSIKNFDSDSSTDYIENIGLQGKPFERFIVNRKSVKVVDFKKVYERFKKRNMYSVYIGDNSKSIYHRYVYFWRITYDEFFDVNKYLSEKDAHRYQSNK